MQQLYRQSEEAWARQDYQRSVRHMEEAAHKEPTNPNIHLFLARLHGLRYDYPAAERCIEKALKISPGNVRTIEEASRVCLAFKNLDMMLVHLEAAVNKKGVSIDSVLSLLDIYFLDNRLDEAGELLAKAEKSDPKDPRVLLAQATLKKERGQVPQAEPLLRDILNDTAADAVTRTRAAYRLAALLDQQGRYDDAMGALLEGKAIQRPQAVQMAPSLQNLQLLNRDMVRSLTKPVLDRWRSEAAKVQPVRPLALLAGHPRSGTTLLEQVLDAHSGVITMEETDLLHDEVCQPLIRSFPKGTGILQMLDSAPPSMLAATRENYFHCAEMYLRQPLGNRLLVDKNPGINLLVPLLVRFFPESKFLVALRDPRDVVLSCFMQPLQITPASSAYLSLEGTVLQYANIMGFWLEMFPRLENQFLKVRYEEMVEDLPAVARSTFDFLKIPFEENALKFHEHARKKRVNSPTQADVKKPLYRTAVGRWKNYEKYLEPYLPALDRFLQEFNYR